MLYSLSFLDSHIISEIWRLLSLRRPCQNRLCLLMLNGCSSFWIVILMRTSIFLFCGVWSLRFPLTKRYSTGYYIRFIFIVCPILSLLSLQLLNKWISLGDLFPNIFGFLLSLFFFRNSINKQIFRVKKFVLEVFQLVLELLMKSLVVI